VAQFFRICWSDFDFQQMHHRAIFRPRNGFESKDRSSLFIAPDQCAQRDRTRHRVRVRVVLKHNRDAIALVNQRAKFADFLPGERLIHRISPPRRLGAADIRLRLPLAAAALYF